MEFSAKVKRAAAKRSQLRCERHLWRDGEICTKPAKEFDHVTPDTFGGAAVLENCAHLCIPCHKDKCREERPALAKSNRQRSARAGIKPKAHRAIAQRPKVEPTPSGRLPIPPRRTDIYGRPL